MDQHEVNLQGALSWSFEFEDQEWFAGFRDLATNGVNKPVLNVFRMFGMMQGNRVEVSTENALSADVVIQDGVKGEQPDINALASTDGKSISIMVWNYHDDDLPADATKIELTVNSLPSNKILTHHYRIDEAYSNSYSAWIAMGRPQKVDNAQYKKLERAGQLQLLDSPQWVEASDGTTTLHFSLPRQGVSFLKLSW